ncbi:glycosyltransferase [Paenibacillus sp. FSL R10-2734]|uniref:glycosyltransferase n=1 Tax=Paenibacillus sp. FSL R10-2734 TaxID=2954691 RepID=UPI0030D7E9F5
MSVLFCHDGPLRKDLNNQYYGIAHTDEMFSRYKVVSDYIKVLIRAKKITSSEEKKLSKITLDNLSIVETPSIASTKGLLLNRKVLKDIIHNQVKDSSFVIARLPSHNGNFAVDSAIKLNKPYLIELVACPWDSLWNHSLKGKLIAPIMSYQTKSKVKRASHVVYVTESFLQHRYPTLGKSINCSNVTLTEFDDRTLQNRLNKIKRINNNEKVVIGTAAAVDVKYKGQQYIIEALGKLKKEGIQHFYYEIVGDGDQQYLKSIAQKNDVTENVSFLGAIPHAMINNWLDNLDIYVQPSRQEGLPRSLIEAMSRGLPSFGARTGGIPELLDENFIFSNSSNNIDEICTILNSFDNNSMKKQAEFNYDRSKNYDKKTIDEKRKRFFIQSLNDLL